MWLCLTCSLLWFVSWCEHKWTSHRIFNSSQAKLLISISIISICWLWNLIMLIFASFWLKDINNLIRGFEIPVSEVIRITGVSFSNVLLLGAVQKWSIMTGNLLRLCFFLLCFSFFFFFLRGGGVIYTGTMGKGSRLIVFLVDINRFPYSAASIVWKGFSIFCVFCHILLWTETVSSCTCSAINFWECESHSGPGSSQCPDSDMM